MLKLEREIMAELIANVHDAAIIKCAKTKRINFKTLVDSLPEFVFETDLKGKVTYVNKKAFEFTALTQKDFDKGIYNIDFFAPSERKRAMKNFENAMQTSTPTFNEYLFTKKDGGTALAKVESVPINIGNKTVGMRGIVIWLSENKKTLEELVFQTQLLDVTGQAIIVADKAEIIRYWNYGATKLYGYSATETTGRNIVDVISTHITQEEKLKFFERLKSGESWNSELQAKHSDGSAITIIVNCSPIINEDKELLGSIIFVINITEEKWMVRELSAYAQTFQESSEKIQELNEKLRVVGGLTRHDIRNKLSAFDGLIYLLKKKTSDSIAVLQYISEMEKVSKQLLSIIEFERIYEQVGSEMLKEVNVENLFLEAISLISDFKGFQTRSECKGLIAIADSLLRQVLYNLMDNTLKYGSKTKRIKLRYKEEGNQLLLIYEDDGVGISEEMKEHLFEKGFGKDSGFGLFMIKRIMEAYHWTIEENGKPGEGVKIHNYNSCRQISFQL